MTINSDVTSDPQNVASESLKTRATDGDLVSWIMSRVIRWRVTRDSNYFDLWDQYFALWRGQWNAKLKIRESERSKIITPATQQAVDATVSEMVEATFGRGEWFDILEDPGQPPQITQQDEQMRDFLLADFARDKVQHAIIETYLNGAIYGTGIAKRIVEKKKLSSYELNSYGAMQESSEDYTCIYWQAIPPYNFVVDTAALTIHDALGCAHETIRPISEIENKQRSGEYYNVPIGSASGYATGIIARGPKGENLEVNILDGTYITEYHGQVPAKYFDDSEGKRGEPQISPMSEYELQDSDKMPMDEPDEMIEAIVVIANGNALLKKERNPFPGGDRGFVAYQHDRVPNRFWGRGVVEKAYNAQLALDAEIRARIDAMALMTYPMVGFDASRLPRNLNFQVRPGKSWLTNGDPEQIIRPIEFGSLNPAMFEHSSDLANMIAMATGTFDQPASSMSSSPQTASAASMAMGNMIKRAKLTMQTIDEDFLGPIVRKSYLAYQTLNPQKYKKNTEFQVASCMSIMAREYEQTQMTNLLAIIPPQSPAFYVVLRAIAENYSGPSRAMLIQAIESMMQPNPQQQQMQQAQAQIQMRGMMAEVAKLEAEVGKLQAEVPVSQAKAKDLNTKAAMEPIKTHIQAIEAATGASKLAHEMHSHQQDHLHDMLSLGSQHTLGQEKNQIQHHGNLLTHHAAMNKPQPKGPSSGK